MLPTRAPTIEVVAASSTAPTTTALRRRRLRQRGVSLVELSVVVTITGVLATLATYSVRERTAEAHSVEAIAMLGNIRTGLLAKADDLTGNSGDMLQIGGRVGGFGGPLGLPGVLGKNDKGNGNSGNSGNGNSGGGIDGDGNNGHGNNPDGCDPDNPGNGGKKCGGDTDSTSNGNSGSGNSNSGGGGGGDTDGDGNNGHGNNESGCDPDNPGNSGQNCSGDSSSGDSSSGSGSSGSGSSGDSSSGSGSSGDGSSGSGSSGSGSSGGSDVTHDNALCSSAAPVPSSLDSVKGGLYQSRASEWSGTRSGGWRCLSISMSGAQRFQYGYDVGSTAVPSSPAPAGADESFAAWARGDLDGDGRNSWFVLSGAAIDGRVTMAPAITIVDKGE